MFAGDWARELSYSLMGLARGRYRVGPLLVRAVDPFGLAQIDRRFRASNEVLVTPAVEPLGQLGTASGNNASGESTPQRIGLSALHRPQGRAHGASRGAGLGPQRHAAAGQP